MGLTEPKCSFNPQFPTTSTEITCTYCQAVFPSRTKLFKHLRGDHNLDSQLEASRLKNLTPSERTKASIAARGAYHNAAHHAYYRAQVQAGVISAEEWETSLQFFCQPLPVAFRLLRQVDEEDVRYQCLKRLRQLVPQDSLEACPALSPELAQVAVIPPRQWSQEAQQALMDCQEIGVANRQEVCSMIPPLLLLQEGDHPRTILDLCAAPGSKSLQIMDQLAAIYRSRSSSSLLVCNDADRKRLLIVARRSRRQPSQTRPFLCLNSSDGRYFPALRSWGGYKVKFDRVLADVPCSGDGTLRKLSAPEWQQWNVKSHLQLHRLQVRLLTRALESVSKGGRVVYSTCSLDPIEDEAVLVTAISRRGGPSVYRIVPFPESLSKDAAKPFLYSKGATTWVVPHPQFGQSNKKDDGNNPIHETFDSVDQVPLALRKKLISPSMFPPRARTEATIRQIWKDHDKPEEKLQHARFYGEILTDEEIARFEEMLPNCGRILPQHLDSGGFFCAIIERVAPVYYPVCYPSERARREANNMNVEEKILSHASYYRYHGRILTNLESVQHMRELLARDKPRNEDVVFEGMATLELALQWLKQHRAYLSGLSEQVWEVERVDTDEEEEPQSATPFKKAYVNDPNRSLLYTRFFPPPHPSLVLEFCDFFGLVTDADQAKQAGVEVFPAHRLIAYLGGDDALTVRSCQDPEQAFTVVGRDEVQPEDAKVHRKHRFLQLVLVSEEVRNLFKGGAKFNPMEVGLSLCWVPIPGYIRENIHVEDGSSRALQSGRYGLLDGAAEFLGRCATKRVLALTLSQALELMESSILDVARNTESNNSIETDHPSWWKRWGRPRFGNIMDWSPGAVIAVVACGTTTSSSEHSTLFLPCVLKSGPNQQGRTIALLAEQRLTEAWERLLQALQEAQSS